MAQSGLGYKDKIQSILILIRPHSSLLVKYNDLCFQVAAIDLEADWRIKIKEYFSNPSSLAKCQIIILAAKMLIAEAHKGIVGAHQGGRKMKWLIWQYEYF